jgi:hypothetical protein
VTVTSGFVVAAVVVINLIKKDYNYMYGVSVIVDLFVSMTRKLMEFYTYLLLSGILMIWFNSKFCYFLKNNAIT